MGATNPNSNGAVSDQFAPLAYHVAVRAYLQEYQQAIWQWYSQDQFQFNHAQNVRLDLLKTTYRLDRDLQTELYEAADDVAAQLDLDIPITIYQAQNVVGLNASIAFLTDEAHIVLSGPITDRLVQPEIKALLAHELGHLMFWRGWDGEYLISEMILSALANDANAQPAHFETVRLFQLYTEVYCDRIARLVTKDPLVAISMLVKITTDLENVDPAGYLAQADEIFSKENPLSSELTHPETFIRAAAVNLWPIEYDATKLASANERIENMIQGELKFDHIDLLGQQELSQLTRRFIDVVLKPTWMKTDAIIAHAKSFFEDYESPLSENIGDDDLGDFIFADEKIQKYLVYVLLDFVTVDRDLENAPLASALQISERIKIKTLFVEAVRKELRLRKKQIDQIDDTKDALIKLAESQQDTP